MSSSTNKKISRTSELVAELSYETGKASSLDFLAKNIKPEMLSSRRAPLLEPSDLFTVRLKKSKRAPASATIKVNDVENLNETSRKQLRFNSCAKNISQVYQHLFISGDMMAKNLTRLQEKGIKYILNLAPSVCKNYFSERKEFTYLSLNLIDSTHEAALLWAFLKSINFIELANPNDTCFVHCHQGVSRSGAMVVAYIMYKDKIPFREAFEVLKAKHEVVSPNSAFIAQLIQFESRLGLKPGKDMSEYDEEVFVIARHNNRDETLVLKSVEIHKVTKNLDNSIETIFDVLDSRGTFIVYKSSSELEVYSAYFLEKFGILSGMFFIYQGHDCRNKATYKQTALEYVKLMKMYINIYEEAQILFVNSDGNFDLPGRNKLDFFTVLGTSETSFKTLSHMDFYFSHDDTVTVRSKALDEVLQDVQKDKNLVIKLYHCKIEDGLHSFEHIDQYDSEDLSTFSCYVLQASDKENMTVNFFIWLGKDIETMINESAAIDLCTIFINTNLKSTLTEQNLVDNGIEVVKEGEESKAFLIAFDTGL